MLPNLSCLATSTTGAPPSKDGALNKDVMEQMVSDSSLPVADADSKVTNETKTIEETPTYAEIKATVVRFVKTLTPDRFRAVYEYLDNQLSKLHRGGPGSSTNADMSSLCHSLAEVQFCVEQMQSGVGMWQTGAVSPEEYEEIQVWRKFRRRQHSDRNLLGTRQTWNDIAREKMMVAGIMALLGALTLILGTYRALSILDNVMEMH